MSQENEAKTFEVFLRPLQFTDNGECRGQSRDNTACAHPAEAAADPVDAAYYVTEYAIALCCKCSRVFLLEILIF